MYAAGGDGESVGGGDQSRKFFYVEKKRSSQSVISNLHLAYFLLPKTLKNFQSMLLPPWGGGGGGPNSKFFLSVK